MADARKRAEEALAADCDPYTSCMDEGQSCHHRMADALRALLAEPAPAAGLRCALPEGQCCHQRATTADVPDSCRVDEDGCCVVCGRDVMGCYACSHAAGTPAPAADAVAEDEIETARAMLGLTVRMAEAKHACRDTTCRNVLTAALNMLLALDARRRG